MELRKFIATTIREYLNENADGGYIKLQRGQFGDVEDGWDFNVVNGQHGEGVYAFKYGDKPMIDYYTKEGETLHTFQIPKKYFVDLSNNNWDFWDAKAYIYIYIIIHNTKHLCLNIVEAVFQQVKRF